MLKLALSAMGYRDMGAGRWAKPVGYHLFTFEMDRMQWANWFGDVSGQISVWESKLFFKENASDFEKSLDFLKGVEAYTRINIDASRRARFELSPLPVHILERSSS